MKLPRLFVSGPSTRTPRKQALYRHYLETVDHSICYFCDLSHDVSLKPIETLSYFYVAPAQYPYDNWDGCTVREHLLLVPKQHAAHLSEVSAEARAEMADVIARYEVQGYSFYGRAPDDVTRSVIHQHTHFFKLERKRRSFLLYIRKPHVLISK